MYYTYGTYSYLHNSIGEQYIEHNGLSHLKFGQYITRLKAEGVYNSQITKKGCY